MKNRHKNIVRSITHNLNRFLSILIIVAIGSGFMAGLAATSPDMYETADEYIDSHGLYDIVFKSPLGFSDEDISAVVGKGLSESVAGFCSEDMVLAKGDKDYTARVMGALGSDGESVIHSLDLKEGRFPENNGECVIESYMGKYSADSPQIGDVLVVSEENSNFDRLQENMSGLELEVVGLVASPMCLGVEGDTTNAGSGSIGINVYTCREQFTYDGYTDMAIVLKESKDYDTFSDEYKDYRDECLEKYEDILDRRIEIKIEDLRTEIDDAAEALKGLRDVLAPIESVENNLSDAEDKGQGVNEEILSLFENTPIYEALAEVSEHDLSAKDSRIEAIDNKLSELKDNIADLSEATYITRTRLELACIASYDSNVGKIAALSKVFPVFFFLVALLVALTTMTRLVEENRIQIGTLKALGFSNANILSEYVLFSLLASVLGCIVGFVIGFRLFPFAINSAYSMLYFLPTLNTPFRVDIALTVAPITIGSILIATFAACWSEFKSCPAVLMVPKAPAAGKRIFLERIRFLWKIMPFSGKVTARNIFRYKKRFFMTIIGVSGCSALLLTGFGIKDSVSDIVDKQYGEINKYELTLAIASDVDIDEDETLTQFLNDSSVVSEYMLASSQSGRLSFERNNEKLSIYIPEDAERTKRFIELRNRKTGEAIDISSGVIVTEKLCEELGLNVGDKIRIENSDGKTALTVLAGITENYIASYAYMSSETYEKLFSSSPEFNHILCNTAESELSTEELTSNAMKSENVIYARASSTLKNSFADSIKSINGVVWVLIFAAGLLCAVVLYNLTNVNICERRKELATIRVLGFYQRETEKYIFREINILSFLGGLAGLILGYFLHAFVIQTIEIDRIMFGREIYLPSYLYAVAITMLFTILVNRIMAFNIRKVDMAAAMKAND